MDLNWVLEEYNGIVYVSDMNTYEIKYMNRVARRVCGITAEELEQKRLKCYEVFQGLDRPCPFCTNQYLKENDFYEWEYQNLHLNRSFLLKDRKFMWEGCEARIEFATDVTEYRSKIANREHVRDSVLKSLPGGIARVDARDLRTILWYGANYLSMIGYTKEQFEQELHSQCTYVHPDDLDRVTMMMSELKKKGGIAMLEMKIITRSGEVRTLTTTLSYEDGETSEDGIPSFYSVGIDITETKNQQIRQQNALKEAYDAARRANQAKTDFLSSMSHDIRTPMNAILGMTSIAEAHVDNPFKIKECLKKINDSSKHLLNLINEVLDMSKIESGKMELNESEFGIADLVRNVFGLCRPLILEQKHQLQIDISAVAHEKIIGDKERLQQVLVNILTNAIKYTNPGGRIKFKIKERPTHVSDISLFSFLFEDNGIGMSEEFVSQIFEPFSRAEDSRTNQTQGTGLGMAISHNLIHMMNGSIFVDSKIGQGSCFTVTVPLKLRFSTEEMIHDLEGKTILVVDDERDTCENTCLLLEQLGMKGKWALNGREAISEIVQAHETGNDFFAIILDWVIPETKGEETVKKIRAQAGPDIPIIIASGYDYSSIEEELIRAEVNGFITKPLFKSEILKVLRQFTNEKIKKKDSEICFTTENGLNGIRLLLVEDNEINREIAQELLNMMGASVETAQNGREALEKFCNSGLEYYHIILMDIQMPVMNGLEATEAIRALERPDAKTVPILAMTANAFSEDILEVKKAGMNEHITKPVEPDTLMHVIQKWRSVTC
ncbi:response regulator [Eisenbergiella sp.]